MKKILSLFPLLFAVLFVACGDSGNSFDISKLAEKDQSKVVVPGYELVDGVIIDAEGQNDQFLIEADLGFIAMLRDDVKEGTTLNLDYDDVTAIKKPFKAHVLIASYTNANDLETKIFYVRNSNKVARSYVLPGEIDTLVESMGESDWEIDESGTMYSDLSEIEKKVAVYNALITDAGVQDFTKSFLGSADVTYDGKPAHFIGIYQAEK